jgi:hypothetical protein
MSGKILENTKKILILLFFSLIFIKILFQMNPILRNILAVIAGLFLGALVNGLVLNLGMKIIPPPTGFDMNTTEGLKAAMPLMGISHFIFPFLAHALGTFIGAMVTAKIAVSNRMNLSMLVGLMFFGAGLYLIVTMDAPMWFNVLDAALAYFPMAYFGASFIVGKEESNF